MFENSRLAKSVKLACAFGAATAALTTPFSVLAQEDDSADKVEKIEITGSRIKRSDIETSSPVLAIDAQVIRSTGFTRIEDVMNTLPQIEAAETSFNANGATGTATLDLRGLGANRTLVLVNGRRLQPGGVYSQAPDVNQIPTALIKRVDVLTGGASTAYGADAVAGVVNFVMDNDFTGLEIQAGAGGYQHNNDNDYIQSLMDERGYDYPNGSNGIGGKDYNLSITAGGDFDGGKGHATVYAVWRRNDEMLQGERDYSSCALNTSATACGGSSTAISPNTFFYPLYDGNGDGILSRSDDIIDYGQEEWLTLNPDGTFSEYGTNNYNYAPVNHFMRPNERFSIGAFAEYEVSDNARVYVETSFMHNRTAGQIAESGTFYGAEYWLSAESSPVLSDSQLAELAALFPAVDPSDDNDGALLGYGAYIGKRNVEGGPRADNLENNSFRIVTGVDGYLNDTWSYDISYMYASTSSSSAYVNDLNLPLIAPRVGDIDAEECSGDCLYYQVFTPGGVTSEMAAQLSGTAILTGNTSLQVFQGYVSGELDYALPSAETPIAVSVGFERRETDFERLSDTVYQEGTLVGQGGPTPSLVGSFDVNEVFAEASVPVLEGVEGVDMLSFDLGIRLSDYTTSGRANAYKLGINWEITENYMIRGSYNRAIRAPNVAELFAAQSVGLWQGTEPCASDTPTLTEAQCALTGVTSAQYGNIGANPADQYNQFSGGNPNLDPEEADTYTLGLVASPVEGFNFSLDYWIVDMEKVIGTVGAERILNVCGTTGQFCDNIVRSPSGSLWLSQDAYVINLSDNIGGRTWRGLDVDANYSMDIGEGTLGLKMIGSLNLEKTYKPLLSDSSLDYDCSGKVSTDCFAQPDWRHTVSANYRMGDWNLIGRWRYYGGVDIVAQGSDGEEKTGEIASYSFFDISGSYVVNEHVQVSMGVNNILDKEPPMVGSSLATNANTVAGFYDTLGRYLFTNVTVSF
ncbi:TonB-dependent receptor domain-containing protein [Aestuariibacter sp. A3R04]|uniref:TonB-dependent receptor domain-containing protein n=1 Tax=Aestuariibacter sp. A3R04 TaxID=2841571 RepID=UPI001C0A30F7|nr:TonB-dependent receptor [Aestuariibacter sp. A3R04]MBU3022270.1 TonB-dependent receptor [Aestuariibacter sp. A3R04]